MKLAFAAGMVNNAAGMSVHVALVIYLVLGWKVYVQIVPYDDCYGANKAARGMSSHSSPVVMYDNCY